MSTRLFHSPLMSNGYMLETTPEQLGQLVPTDPGLPMGQLREQYRAQGYLWLKGLLDREEVLAFRCYFFTTLQDTGLLMPGHNLVDGIYSGGGQRKDLVSKGVWNIVRSAEFEAFCTTPRIWNFYTAFLEDEPQLLKRKILRYNIPQERNCTGGHYDLIYLRAGTDRLCSSWIPFGDIPVEMGGLVYLEHSDTLGRALEAEFSAKNAHFTPEERISAYNKNMREDGWVSADLPDMARRFKTRWLAADYEAGDMVIHSPYMIHAATTNKDTQGHIRLSTDIRYQRASDVMDNRWNQHWATDDML